MVREAFYSLQQSLGVGHFMPKVFFFPLMAHLCAWLVPAAATVYFDVMVPQMA